MKSLFVLCLLFSMTTMAADIKVSELSSLGSAAFDPTDLFIIVDTPNSETKATTLADLEATFFTKGVNKHLLTPGTSPAAAPETSAGTSATCAVTHGSDNAGIVTLVTTATLPGTGAVCTITFHSAFGAAPICLLQAASAVTASQEVLVQNYVTSTTGTLVINHGASDAAGHTYVYNYYCVETQ